MITRNSFAHLISVLKSPVGLRLLWLFFSGIIIALFFSLIFRLIGKKWLREGFLFKLIYDSIFSQLIDACTLIIGFIVITLLNIPYVVYWVPLHIFWMFFVVEIMNFLRIAFEEYRNETDLPLVKKSTLMFFFYPMFSACWLLSPWVLHKKNIVSVYFSINTYDYYWTQRRDINYGAEPAFILYLLTREAVFLHTIPDGFRFGNEKTFIASKKRFLKLISNEMDFDKKEFLSIYQFMIQPLLMLYHKNDPRLKKRIDILFDEIYSKEFTTRLGQNIQKYRFFHTWKNKRIAISPRTFLKEKVIEIEEKK
ncbi:hypothetical protein ACFL35_02745 [Candidatus Riflebacteria bacterium]